MRVIALRTLREFWQTHTDAEQPLRTWYAKAKQSEWATPAEVKMTDRSASILANNRVVFNIKGNTYRLVTALDYQYGVVYIRFIGTHRAYDQIDATTI
ncbi:MAG: type II toxin-antitoxin system HigB family toxin [Caldilineaceae bacterium]|nr:type II toxin-antitoxin system HigB family toxin [Caldilineaceae bacterium]